MTDQELSELLSHPRVRAFMERVAEDAAARVYAQFTSTQKALLVGKWTASDKGDLNYPEAAEFIGCRPADMRYYVFHRKLVKGKKRATVTIASCIRFKQTFRPRPNGRISG